MKKIFLILVLLSVIPVVFAQNQCFRWDSEPNSLPNIESVCSYDCLNGLSLFQMDLNDRITSSECPVVHPEADFIGINQAGTANQNCKPSRGTQTSCPGAVDIARNSGGKHGEGRLPTAYSRSLKRTPYLVDADIARNSGGGNGGGRLPTAYSKSLSSPTASVPVTDIARNSGGKHGEGRRP